MFDWIEKLDLNQKKQKDAVKRIVWGLLPFAVILLVLIAYSFVGMGWWAVVYWVAIIALAGLVIFGAKKIFDGVEELQNAQKGADHD